MLKGRVHSSESFGTVDGPGIRFVVFFQGCPMCCLYCHNRDTWEKEGGREATVDELMADVISYKRFLLPNGGGVTASGGEALLQREFITEWFKACHAEGISTCLDTNGLTKQDQTLDALMAETDFVILDLKQLNDDIHQKLTGVSNKPVLAFAQYLQKMNKRTWIRYVVVPGWTDDDASAHALGHFIQGMTNIEKVEVLGYHKLGIHKWKLMGEKYPLEGIEPPSNKAIDHIQAILNEYL